MKDLRKYFNPASFEVREACEVNSSLVSHIPYTKTFTEHSVKKYLYDAVEEMIVRFATKTENNFVLAQFADEGVRGASDIIVNSVKNAVCIIAALLSRIDISTYYVIPENKEEEFDIRTDLVDNIVIREICNKTSDEITVKIDYEKLLLNGDTALVSPFFVSVVIPIVDKYDTDRGIKLVSAGDSVYYVGSNTKGFLNCELDEVDPDCKSNIETTCEMISNNFEKIVTMVYNAVYKNSKMNCSACPNNRLGNDCLFCEVDVDKAKDYLEENAFFVNSDEKDAFKFKLLEKDVTVFKRFDIIARRMVEYSLLIEDYINTPEKEEAEESAETTE